MPPDPKDGNDAWVSRSQWGIGDFDNLEDATRGFGKKTTKARARTRVAPSAPEPSIGRKITNLNLLMFCDICHEDKSPDEFSFDHDPCLACLPILLDSMWQDELSRKAASLDYSV